MANHSNHNHPKYKRGQLSILANKQILPSTNTKTINLKENETAISLINQMIDLN